MTKRIDIDKPLWNQNTFVGRFKHFFWVTDPRTCFVSEEALDKAKDLVEQYRKGLEPPGTTLEQIIYAKKLYESAFHPDTGDKQNLFGRMSFQAPGNMVISAAMLQWYQNPVAVVFWQWFNQSFNALVNYTNRNAKSPTTTKQLLVAYVSASSSAVSTALALKKYFANARPILQRWVPFAAVAAANCINLPLMRQNEIRFGIDCADENGNIVGQSKLAAVKGISQVVISRITMAAPTMLTLPLIMERAEKLEFMKKRTYVLAPIQIVMIGISLIFLTPFGCALFPQRCSIKTSTLSLLEPGAFEKMKKNSEDDLPARVYFNKGL